MPRWPGFDWDDKRDQPVQEYRSDPYRFVVEELTKIRAILNEDSTPEGRQLTRWHLIPQMRGQRGRVLLENARAIAEKDDRSLALALIARFLQRLGGERREIEPMLDEALAVEGISDHAREVIVRARIKLLT